MCWRSCLRTNTLAFNTCRVNRRIFTKWTEFKWRRGGIQIAVYLKRLQFPCRGQENFLFHKLFNRPDFSESGRNRIYQGQRSRKGMTASRGLEITTLLQPEQSRHADSSALRSTPRVPKVAFSNHHNGAGVINFGFLPPSCSDRCSPAKSIVLWTRPSASSR